MKEFMCVPDMEKPQLCNISVVLICAKEEKLMPDPKLCWFQIHYFILMEARYQPVLSFGVFL